MVIIDDTGSRSQHFNSCLADVTIPSGVPDQTRPDTDHPGQDAGIRICYAQDHDGVADGRHQDVLQNRSQGVDRLARTVLSPSGLKIDVLLFSQCNKRTSEYKSYNQMVLDNRYSMTTRLKHNGKYTHVQNHLAYPMNFRKVSRV